MEAPSTPVGPHGGTDVGVEVLDGLADLGERSTLPGTVRSRLIRGIEEAESQELGPSNGPPDYRQSTLSFHHHIQPHYSTTVACPSSPIFLRRYSFSNFQHPTFKITEIRHNSHQLDPKSSSLIFTITINSFYLSTDDIRHPQELGEC